jgi:hypothetical protein
MKFTWFHLMPYRYLPEDFKDKYRSVWVDIPRDLYDPKVGHRLYNELLLRRGSGHAAREVLRSARPHHQVLD